MITESKVGGGMDNRKPEAQVPLAALTGSASAWCESRVEEVIGTLWLIAAFVALDAGCPKWVFVSLFVKAGLDMMCAISYAIKDIAAEASKRQNDQAQARRTGGVDCK